VVQVVGAERSGKSEFTAMDVVGDLAVCERVAVCAQEYDETRSEMEKMRVALRKMGGIQTISAPKRGKWEIVTPAGCIIETISFADGPEELTGTGLAYDVVVICEAGLVRYDCFLAARGRVTETRGRVVLSGTMHDSIGWYADMYETLQAPNVLGGRVFAFPAWSNRAVFPGGKDDPEIAALRAIYSEDEFARRVEAKLVPSPARVYPEFQHVVHVPFPQLKVAEDEPVYLAIDAGWYPSRYAVLAIQVRNASYQLPSGSTMTTEAVMILDEVWVHHTAHEDVIDICRQRPWWSRVQRAIGGHESKQHPASASTAEVWRAEVGKDSRDPKRFGFETFDAGRVLDGVQRVRTLLKDPASKVPRILIDPRCHGTLHELGAYSKPVDRRMRVLSDQPKDQDNDCMDALRVFAVRRFGLADRGPRRRHPGRRRVASRG